MPAAHVAIGHLNKMLGDPEFLKDPDRRNQLARLYEPTVDLGEITAQMIGDDSPLGYAMRGADPSTIGTILSHLPESVLEAARAVVYRNLQRETPLGMTFAWLPAYEHEITVCESPATKSSPGWITVVIKGRYPADPHPVTGRAMEPPTG